MKNYIILIAVVIFISGCCCPKKSEEQIKADKEQREIEKAEKAKDKAILVEARKRCGKNFGETFWEESCRELVSEKLFQPSSASFSFLMSVARTNDPKKCRMTYSSTVKSKNAFGATIEHRFVCNWDVKKDNVTLDAIGMN